MPDLFDTTRNWKATDTSRQAALEAAETSETLRRKVLDALKSGPKTVDEVCAETGLERCQAAPRFTELQRLGAISDSGERRLNGRGKRVIIWRAL